MMPPLPPRRRFQIHLSTAIVLMFTAGAIIWVNTIARHKQLYRSLLINSEAMADTK